VIGQVIPQGRAKKTRFEEIAAKHEKSAGLTRLRPFCGRAFAGLRWIEEGRRSPGGVHATRTGTEEVKMRAVLKEVKKGNRPSQRIPEQLRLIINPWPLQVPLGTLKRQSRRRRKRENERSGKIGCVKDGDHYD